jgi:hypothetical protein
MYKDWIIEKSTTDKTHEDYDNDLSLIKYANTIMTEEAPSDQNKKQADVKNGLSSVKNARS